MNNLSDIYKKYRLNKVKYLFSIIIFLAFFVVFTRSYIPSKICIFNDEDRILNLPSKIFSVENDNETISVSTTIDKKTFGQNTNQSSKVTVKFLGIPIKSAEVNVLNSKKLIPSGKSLGINIKTDGIMVLGTGNVTDDDGNTIRPWENKLKAKDIILEANGIKLDSKEQLIEIISTSDKIEFLICRNDITELVIVETVKSSLDNNNKIGIWVRDGTEGIGTLTYINPTTNNFGALGHGVLDVDTNELMPVKKGTIYDSKITTINKGLKGSPGELVGQISTMSNGNVIANTNFGIYGNWTSEVNSEEALEIALKDELKIGPAYILCDIGDGVQKFNISIDDINLKSTDEKGMIIRITDENLISKTNGIIQGMSGSPIIQDEKIVGAVTHVFIQDPTKGYGIFIENMLSEEKNIG